MEAVNPTVLKTTIEAIQLGGLKDRIINSEPALDNTDNTILCAIIIAKLSTTTHKNVVNSTNEEDTQLLWRSILRRFISNKPSNRARVYFLFASIVFDPSDIKKNSN
ncbi:hypothetical protein Pst134EA_031227 [Puccinia striiformis f. sp. tritici]|uniref:uncharacterized protein n=1 Tax=Puccinia striiformis f. sp. tritici TaxID=168172 RepID=UPI00200880BF|nr:uncharacterized protein Pst134EA_031227 [Puccinia striiformis f. sp. tritici]KAH9445393.1 hypothetical protein Pst134EA_031227 [Puccinia striiformis f. sp. tritici]